MRHFPATAIRLTIETCVWLRDFASSLASPSSGNHKFVCTDINPADFPKTSSATFEYHMQDVKKAWPQEWKQYFDLVHQRLALSAAGPEAKEVVTSLADLVKPGGWIMFEDPTASVKHETGPTWAKALTIMEDLMAVMGSRVGVIDEVPEWLKELGFINVQEKVFMTKYGALNENEKLAKKGVAHARTTLMGFRSAAKSK
ncbi:hypothetical protein K491DRAFT_693385 [Lophiostoma macrostomum CBS 122681]|uniref:S-adenosyl-L-methionine-dependent methyltransferase n=1 Tax=Lophiostoma macrostomum CBS 122681 TaxID=1314788 RepID=A0A6A6T4L2_9PLEO|nr:hypothetical protein K491DRAFT_693385 [Lophiostoma macrostomum CBS 122681]